MLQNFFMDYSMSIGVGIAIAVLGFACGAYTGKGKKLGGIQPLVLWLLVAVFSLAAIFLFLCGGPIPYFAAGYLLLCVTQLLGLIFYTGREEDSGRTGS